MHICVWLKFNFKTATKMLSDNITIYYKKSLGRIKTYD